MDAERLGVCGKYKFGKTTDAERDLTDWYEQHELQYSKSYMQYKRMRAWWHMSYTRFYRLF